MDTETTAGTIEAVMIEMKDEAVTMIDAVDMMTETDMEIVEVVMTEDTMIEGEDMMTGKVLYLILVQYKYDKFI